MKFRLPSLDTATVTSATFPLGSLRKAVSLLKNQNKMAVSLEEVVSLLEKQADDDATQVHAKYQAYSSVALIATLQVGFGLADFADADVDDFWGFLHATTLALIIVINFAGAGALSLEYFYALRLFASERMDDMGDLAYPTFTNQLSNMRKNISFYVIKSMVLYVLSIGFKFAKNNKAAIINWKVITVLSLFATGGLVLAALFLKVNIELRRSLKSRLKDQPTAVVLADMLSYKFTKIALPRLELARLYIIRALEICRCLKTQQIMKGKKYKKKKHKKDKKSSSESVSDDSDDSADKASCATTFTTTTKESIILVQEALIATI